jgi:hypothetical protein
MIGAIRSVFYEGRNDDVQLIICLINPEGMVDIANVPHVRTERS